MWEKAMVYLILGLVILMLLWLMFGSKTPSRSSRQSNQPGVPRAAKNDLFTLPANDEGRAVGKLARIEASELNELEILRSQILHIPSLPVAWWEVDAAIEHGDGIEHIAEIIVSDPVLENELLRVANTPALNPGREPMTVQQATGRLGFHAVRGIVLSHALVATPELWKGPFPVKQVWKHAIAVSVLAPLVARHIDGCKAGLSGVVGLLHDIGRIALNTMRQTPLSAKPDPQVGFLAYEVSQFGCTHIDAGVLLAEHWRLPEILVQGIAHHHHPACSIPDEVPATVRREVLAVCLADMLAIHAGFDGGNRLLAAPKKEWEEMLDTPLQSIASGSDVVRELARVKAINL